MTQRWARIGVTVTAVAMIGILGFSTWSAAIDPRRTDAVTGVTTVDLCDNGFAPFAISVETGTEVTFGEPDVYDFICTILPLSMRGRVLVTDG